MPIWSAMEIKDPCTTCRNRSWKQAHSVNVKIPAGVETGQQIRLAGQGEAGFFNGGPYGDLYVVVNAEPSDRFERDGSTIYYKLDLNFVQAALEIRSMPTVHGDVDWSFLKEPKTGKKFRLQRA